LDGLASYAVAINDRGTVVGLSGEKSWIWRNDEIWALPNPAKLGGLYVRDINNDGKAVGFGSLSLSRGRWAVLWNEDKLQILPSLSTTSDVDDVALSINQRDWIVGSSSSDSGKTVACVWHENKVYDLNKLVQGDRRGIRLLEARFVSDNGAICGIAKRNGKAVDFILYPLLAES